nr:TIR domain-containing protein [Bifidobacterium miconis]
MEPAIQYTAKTDTLSTSEYDANIFLSYRHQDNEYLDNAIIDLARGIVQSYEYQTGKKLHLFMDTEIQWGSDWQKILDDNIAKANILLVAVTPMYLKSDPCRKELLEFDTRAGQNSGNKILSMIWQNIDVIPDNGTDPVRNIIQSRQFISVEDLAYEPTNTRSYKQRVSEIASALQKTVAEQNEKIDQTLDHVTRAVKDESSSNNDADYLSMLAKAEESSDSIQADITDFTQSLNNIMNRLNANPLPKNTPATGMISWGNRISSESHDDIEKLDASIRRISATWDNYYVALQLYIDQIASMPMGSLRNQQIDMMMNNLDQLSNMFTVPAGVQQAIDMLRVLGNLIRPVRPVTASITDALTFFSSIRTQAKSLRNRLGTLPR